MCLPTHPPAQYACGQALHTPDNVPLHTLLLLLHRSPVRRRQRTRPSCPASPTMAAASSAANDANVMPKFIPAFPTSHRLLDDALRPVTIPRNLRPYHLRRQPSTTVSSPPHVRCPIIVDLSYSHASGTPPRPHACTVQEGFPYGTELSRVAGNRHRDHRVRPQARCDPDHHRG